MSGVNVTKFLNLFRGRHQSVALTHELAEIYKPSINRHKETLIELIKEKAEKASQSQIAHKLRELKGFYTLEMAPPTSADEMKRIKEDLALVFKFIKTGCFKFLTVKQAWLLFLVGTEVGLWFFLGETIGKWHIVGYQV